MVYAFIGHLCLCVDNKELENKPKCGEGRGVGRVSFPPAQGLPLNKKPKNCCEEKPTCLLFNGIAIFLLQHCVHMSPLLV